MTRTTFDLRRRRTCALLLVVVPTIALLAPGCTRNDDESATATIEEPEAAPTNRIDIPATVRRNLGITFVAVERRRVDATIRVPGAFELEPLARREYRLTLPGTVRLEVDQYARVDTGDVLFRFRSPAWSELQHEIIVAEQAIASAGADIDVARAGLEEAARRLALLRTRLETLSEAEIRNAELEARAAEIEAAMPRLEAELARAHTRRAGAERAREHALRRASTATAVPRDRLDDLAEPDDAPVPAYLAIDWITVRAIEPGIVEQLAVTDGAYADGSSLVLSTVDPDRVRFRAMALQADLARLGAMSEARIVPPSSPGIPLGDVVDASVTVGLEAHPDQRTVPLLAMPAEGRSWIRPGVSAFLEVVVEATGGPALAIPRAAIVRDGITHVFFRRDPNDANKAIRTEADMGVDDGRWVAIQSGLSLRDEVVLDGAYELKLASERSGVSQKGGHFHADGTFHADDH